MNHPDYDYYRARTWFAELDGLRAISVLMVISVHLKYPQVWNLSGHLGVRIFFILSGFLITTLALREEARRGYLSVGGFMIRRAFRIFPLYYLTLLLYLGVIFAGGREEQKQAIVGMLPALAFYYPEVPYFYEWFASPPFDHAWSLGIEEKFYLIWPLIMFVLLRGVRATRLTVAIAATLFFAVVPLVFPAALAGCLHPYTHILLGCVLAFLLHDRRWFDRMRFLATPAVRLALALLMIAIQFRTAGMIQTDRGGLWVFGYSLVATALLGSLVMSDGTLPRLLSYRPLALIGSLSYGIYLIHMFAVSAAQKIADRLPGEYLRIAVAYVIASALAIAGAWVLSRTIERPMIRLGRRLGERWMDRVRKRDTVMDFSNGCVPIGAPRERTR